MKIRIIKVWSLFAVAAFASLTISSCKNEAKPEDAKEVAEEQNEAKFEEDDNMEDDAAFLVAAAEYDLMEIEVGKLAIQRGTNSHVKEIGKMLVDHHTKSADDTKMLAARLNVTLPGVLTEKGKDRFEDLNDEKSGADFDKKFADVVVNAHEETIKKMEKASEKGTDPELRTWAADLLPTLRSHLEHAKKLENQINANQ